MNNKKDSYIVKGVCQPDFANIILLLFSGSFLIMGIWGGFYIPSILFILLIIYSISEIKKERANRNSFIEIDKSSFLVFDALTSEDYDIKWKEIEQITIYNERTAKASVEILKINLKKDKYPLEFVLTNYYKINYKEFYKALLFYNPSINLSHPKW